MSTIEPSEIKYYKSSQNNSAGGTITNVEIPRTEVCTIFPQLSRMDLKFGSETYRKVFFKNTDPLLTLSSPRFWILFQPTQGGEMAIGVGTPTDVNGLVPTYVSPTSKEAALTFPDLAPGEACAVWIRRITPANMAEFTSSAFQLAVEGLTSA